MEIGGLMKLITPFTILNQNFQEMDLIREAIKNRRLATERLHEDYKKIYKKPQFTYQYLMEFLTNVWNNQPTTVMGTGVATFVLLGIYISLLNTYQ